ncbi:MAG TPA: hypothetical protein VK436_17260 [Methanocella sp.]|nr:hypothetical protein [Methanocella sp.]
MEENATIGKGCGEFRKVSLALSLTMFVCYITGVLYINAEVPELIPVYIASSALLLLVIGPPVLYSRIKKLKGGEVYMDERSDQCTLKATRNAFIVTLLALSVYMILGQWKPDSLYRILALQTIFGVTVSAYIASYFYYQFFR